MRKNQKIIVRKTPLSENYVVEQLVNRVEPIVGSYLTPKELKNLVETSPDWVTVTVHDKKD